MGVGRCTLRQCFYLPSDINSNTDLFCNYLQNFHNRNLQKLVFYSRNLFPSAFLPVKSPALRNVFSWTVVHLFLYFFSSIPKISQIHQFCPHVTNRIPLDGFSWNFMLDTFIKMCSENSRVAESGQKYRTFYVIHSAMCSSVMQRALIVAIPWQQWLREREGIVSPSRTYLFFLTLKPTASYSRWTGIVCTGKMAAMWRWALNSM